MPDIIDEEIDSVEVEIESELLDLGILEVERSGAIMKISVSGIDESLFGEYPIEFELTDKNGATSTAT